MKQDTPGQVRWEIVTPAKANRWLENVAANRGVNDAYVRLLANEIRERRFVPNGETIKFYDDGRLFDGQHRLWAVIEADQSVQMLTVHGLMSDATLQYTTDVGRKRSLADALKMRDEHEVTTLAAATALQWRFINGQITQYNVSPSIGQALDVLERHPGLRRAVTEAQSLRRHFAFRPTLLAWGLYVMDTISGGMDDLDDDTGLRFWEGFAKGNDLSLTDPRYHLRERVLLEQRTPRMRLAPTYMLALVIKAWNAWGTGDPMKNLRWRRSGDTPEAFPELYGRPVLEEIGWFKEE